MAASPPGTCQPCFQPSTRCVGKVRPFIVATQPAFSFCGSTRMRGARARRAGRRSTGSPDESRRTSRETGLRRLRVDPDQRQRVHPEQRVRLRQHVGRRWCRGRLSSPSHTSNGTLRPRIRASVLVRKDVRSSWSPMCRSGPLPQGKRAQVGRVRLERAPVEGDVADARLQGHELPGPGPRTRSRSGAPAARTRRSPTAWAARHDPRCRAGGRCCGCRRAAGPGSAARRRPRG